MITRDRIIAALDAHGPCQSLQVKRTVGEADTTTIGAMLSELKASGKVCITQFKKGGGPFYYLPGQEHLLERLFPLLDPKDAAAATLLRDDLVVRDDALPLPVRNSLRTLKDFAYPLEANRKGEPPVLFWKWHAAKSEDAQAKIRTLLAPKPSPQKTAPAPKTKSSGKKGSTLLEKALSFMAENDIRPTTTTIITPEKEVLIEALVPTPLGLLPARFAAIANPTSGAIATTIIVQDTRLPLYLLTLDDPDEEAMRLIQAAKGVLHHRL